jgi:membrane protein
MTPKTHRAERGIKAFVDLWRDRFAEHNLLTWASAIAFQVLVALVPLSLLSLGVLGTLGEQSVWRRQLLPTLERRLPRPTFQAIDYAAEKILTHASAGLIVFAVILSLWEISGSVRAVGGALNQIYDTKEKRPAWRRFVTSFAIAIVIACCVVGAILAVTLAKHADGSVEALLGIARWAVALLLLGIAVHVLVRFAPAEPRSERWVSLGTIFIVTAWAVESLIFRWYVSAVADFKSTWGTFVAVLVLTGYLYTSAIVFLVGVEADELVRRGATKGETGLLKGARAALG